jgi:GT2 family glycosyltransferase
MIESVAVVIVTYNRIEMLKQCIIAVLKQTYPIEKIVVVDNASSDGTCEWLKNNILPVYKNVELIGLVVNSGGAGGFNQGFISAASSSSQYIWVMDDDVEPEATCLENLVNCSKGYIVVQPTRFNLDGSLYVWHHHFEPLSYTRYRTKIELEEDYDVNMNIVSFEGVLFPRSVIEACGYPDTNYFICEDDTIYGYKVSRRFPIIYTSKAKMRRLGVLSNNQAPWKLFYLVRNKLWNMRVIRGDFRDRPALIILSFLTFPFSLLRDFLLCRFSLECYKFFFKGLFHGIFKSS